MIQIIMDKTYVQAGGDPQRFSSQLLRDKDIKAIKKEIVDALKTISSDRKMLFEFQSFIRRFHRYSLWNTILIFMQYPNASQVAGYRTWQKVGRYVRRGERGILIFAPLIKTIENKDNESDKATRKILHGFTTVVVFAYEQTNPMDGKGFEIPAFGKLLTPKPNKVYASLMKLAVQEGLKVIEKNLEFAKAGSTNGNVIWINRLNSTGAKCLTLIHELSHVMLGHAGERKDVPVSQKEVEAECCSFLVALSLGIPRGCHEYIQYWGGLDDKAVEESLKASERILGQIIRRETNAS